MEDLPAAAMHSVGSCMHQFCKGCLESHIQTQLRCRALPVICPAVHCRNGIDADECSVLLHHKKDIALLTQVICINCLCPTRSVYAHEILQCLTAAESMNISFFTPRCSATCLEGSLLVLVMIGMGDTGMPVCINMGLSETATCTLKGRICCL